MFSEIVRQFWIPSHTEVQSVFGDILFGWSSFDHLPVLIFWDTSSHLLNLLKIEPGGGEKIEGQVKG
jgi:hypothetical protein